MSLPDEGLYKAKIQDWGLDRAGKAKKGNVQWWAKIRVTAQADNPDDPEQGFTDLSEPLTRFLRLTFTEKALDLAFKQLKTLGYNRSNFDDLDKRTSDNPFDFKGTEFVAYCQHDEYNGRVSDKWNVARQKAPALPAGDIQHLNNLFGDKLASMAEECEPALAER